MSILRLARRLVRPRPVIRPVGPVAPAAGLPALLAAVPAALVAVGLLLAVPSLAEAQHAPGEHHSPNMRLVAHVPLAGAYEVSDIEIEQELSRPYAYVSRMGRSYVATRVDGASSRPAYAGFQIIDLRRPEEAKVLYTWFIDDPELHQGRAMDGKYFKLGDRYYYVQSFQFNQGTPDHDLGAVVFDVTGLPDTSTIREVGRIRTPDTPGGFHNVFMYRHSDGRALLFATVESPLEVEHGMNVYDMARFVAGDEDDGLVSRIPLPEPRGAPRGYHDAYVAYHAESGQDRFYGGGPETTYEGGNFVFDVSDPTRPELLATVRAVEGQQSGGHTFVATPDGRYVLTEMTSLAHAPIRIYDIQPALDGERPIVKEPIGAWTFDWRKSAHNMEVRWPYVFISAYEGGLQVIDIRNPTEPRTVGFYDTYNYDVPYEGAGTANGLFGVDVRNADGLIVGSDLHSGFWAFRLDGFHGWNGNDWGVPNVSSVQYWDIGPVRALEASGGVGER